MARQLAETSLHSFGWSKQLLTDSLHTPLEAQLERERQTLTTCASNSDGREGLQAFVEKRRPRYRRP